MIYSVFKVSVWRRVPKCDVIRTQKVVCKWMEYVCLLCTHCERGIHIVTLWVGTSKYMYCFDRLQLILHSGCGCKWLLYLVVSIVFYATSWSFHSEPLNYKGQRGRHYWVQILSISVSLYILLSTYTLQWPEDAVRCVVSYVEKVANL